MRRALIGAAMMCSACSSSTDGGEPAFNCAIGELTGTWHVTYAETNGNCGPLADETVVLSAGSTGSSQCQFATNQIASDKCRVDQDFTCPITGTGGTQHWAGATKQTATDRLEGSLTVQVTSGGLACRSSYNVTWTRQ